MSSEIKDSIKDAAPLSFAVFPFAAVFGALAAEAGLGLFEILLASASIFAGASQYAMLDLMGQNVPAWAIILTVFAINFRHVLYSASLGRKFRDFSFVQKCAAFFMLTDLQYAVGEQRSLKQKLTANYYFSFALVLYGVWMGGNLFGALFGDLIENPAAFGLDFILPIYFVGLVVGFRASQNFILIMLASAISSLLVWWFLGTPWHITIGGGVGLLVAALLSKPKSIQPVDSEVISS